MDLLTKISFFMPTFEKGGVEKLFLTIAKSVESQYLIEFVFPGKIQTQFLPILKEYKLKEFNITKSYGEGKVLLSLPRLIKYIQNTDSKIIIASPGYSTLVLILAKMISKSSIKIILVVDIKISMFQKSKKLYQRIIPVLAKILYKRSDFIITSYKGVEQELIDKYYISKTNIKTIYPPILQNNIFKLANEEVEDSFFNNSNMLLSIGRLVKEKDFECLLYAFNNLMRTNPNYTLAILGEGPEKNNLINLITKLNLNEKVKLLGYDSNPYKYIRKSKVLVVSSTWEAFGFTIIEAMALGKQVVLTDVASQGPQEIIEFGKLGFISKISDDKDLSRTILKAFNNPIDKELLQKKSLTFFYEKNKDEYLKIINKIMEEKNGK